MAPAEARPLFVNPGEAWTGLGITVYLARQKWAYARAWLGIVLGA